MHVLHIMFGYSNLLLFVITAIKWMFLSSNRHHTLCHYYDSIMQLVKNTVILEYFDAVCWATARAFSLKKVLLLQFPKVYCCITRSSVCAVFNHTSNFVFLLQQSWSDKSVGNCRPWLVAVHQNFLQYLNNMFLNMLTSTRVNQ